MPSGASRPVDMVAGLGRPLSSEQVLRGLRSRRRLAAQVAEAARRLGARHVLHTGTFDLPASDRASGVEHYLYCDHSWALARTHHVHARRYSARAMAAFEQAERELLRGLSHVFTFGAYVRDNLIAHYGLPAERVTAVGSGMGAIEPYDGPKSYDKPALLFVAKHLFQAKGGVLLLEAFELARRRRPDLTLTVVGDERSRAFVGNRPGIAFHAHLPWQALQQLFRDATLLVQPMLNDPWGQVYLEAMASRTPGHGAQPQRSAGTGRRRPARLPGRPRRAGGAGRSHPERRVRSATARAHGIDRPAPCSEELLVEPRGRANRLFPKRCVNREVGSMSRKVALITGITGQDGAYLADFLLSQGYIVHGIKRRSSSFNTERIDHLYRDRHDADVRLFLHYGDMTDSTNLMRLLGQIKPTEIYNLAAQSHVQVSFETPEYTANTDALGTLRLLEAIRILSMQDGVRFYQASTSELFGKVQETPQRETHAVLSAQPLRGGQALCLLDHGELPRGLRHARLERHPVQPRIADPRRDLRHPQDHARGGGDRARLAGLLYLGNLDAQRDWGHARDYVEGMWRILQQDEPDDYVLATGETHTVREFVELAFHQIGQPIDWRGEGDDEQGCCRRTGRVLVAIDGYYRRPTEVDLLLGDPAKALAKLGWRHRTSFRELVAEMVEADRLVMKNMGAKNGHEPKLHAAQ